MSNHRNEDRKEDIPPHSRIFIVCSKDLSEQDLKDAFSEYGAIENVYIPKDRSTGNPRGVAYIKYNKTSSAAAAIDGLNLKTIGNSNKPLKVMIASKRDDKNDNSSDLVYDRIFIKTPKQSTEEEIKEHFSKFGKINSVLLLKDKNTNEFKGLGFVKFRSFYEAAKAIEECDERYKAVFAEPKQELKRGRDDRQPNDNFGPYNGLINRPNDNYIDYYNNDSYQPRNYPQPLLKPPLIKTQGLNYKAVVATCSPSVGQAYIERLFNIIPGLQHFQYNDFPYDGYCRSLVTYDNENSAAHAVDRLNNFEFPSGQLVTVKPDDRLSKAADDLTNILSSFKNAVDSGSPDMMQLANAIAQASTLIKAATSKPDGVKLDSSICSVPIPQKKPLAPEKSAVVKRCFVVCKPRPPPPHVLQDIFCRFGDLIDVMTFHNKTFAFARYASEKPALDAIKTLDGSTIFGSVQIKVIEADEPKNKDKDQKMAIDDDDDDETEHDGEPKRIKL